MLLPQIATDVHPQADGTFLVDGGTSVRDLNRFHGFGLPTDGPKTLSGIIVEYLEAIPEPGTTVLIADYPLEVVQTTGNAVKTVRICQRLKRRQPEPE